MVTEQRGQKTQKFCAAPLALRGRPGRRRLPGSAGTARPAPRPRGDRPFAVKCRGVAPPPQGAAGRRSECSFMSGLLLEVAFDSYLQCEIPVQITPPFFDFFRPSGARPGSAGTVRRAEALRRSAVRGDMPRSCAPPQGAGRRRSEGGPAPFETTGKRGRFCPLALIERRREGGGRDRSRVPPPRRGHFFRLLGSRFPFSSARPSASRPAPPPGPYR